MIFNKSYESDTTLYTYNNIWITISTFQYIIYFDLFVVKMFYAYQSHSPDTFKSPSLHISRIKKKLIVLEELDLHPNTQYHIFYIQLYL